MSAYQILVLKCTYVPAKIDELCSNKGQKERFSIPEVFLLSAKASISICPLVRDADGVMKERMLS